MKPFPLFAITVLLLFAFLGCSSNDKDNDQVPPVADSTTSQTLAEESPLAHTVQIPADTTQDSTEIKVPGDDKPKSGKPPRQEGVYEKTPEGWQSSDDNVGKLVNPGVNMDSLKKASGNKHPN